MHASLNGGSERRRLFTVNFGEQAAEDVDGARDAGTTAPWLDSSEA